MWDIYMAVPGGNRTLFRCVFRAHYRVRSAVTQYFRYRWGSYVLCKLMNTWHVSTVCMAPTLNGSSVLQHFERGNALEIRKGIMSLPHIYIVRMSPALNGSSTLERFERSNGSKIRNGIMFDFYPGLPHIYILYIYIHSYNRMPAT